MKTTNWGRLFLALTLTAALAACGGDGGDGSTPSGGEGSSNTGGGDTANTGGGDGDGDGETQPSVDALTYYYRSLVNDTSVDSFSATLASQGAEGYRFIGPVGFTSGSAYEMTNLFAKDVNSTYEYHLLDTKSTESDTLDQLNSQGQSGFKYYGDLSVGSAGTSGVIKSVFIRDQTSPGVFEYKLLASTADRQSFLSQANEQGNAGYWYVSGVVISGLNAKNLYMKDTNQSSSKYEYKASDNVSGRTQLENQLNEQGNLGFRFKGADFSVGNIYVKDSSHDSTFSYQIEDSQNSSSAFVSRANELGKTGFGLWGTLTEGDVYVKPGNCKGFLCTVLSPLAQN